jgi:hypothetical protein
MPVASLKASAEVSRGSTVTCVEAGQLLCMGQRCEHCVTPKQQNLGENGPVELGSRPGGLQLVRQGSSFLDFHCERSSDSSALWVCFS